MAIKCCFGCVPPKRHRACWDTCPDYIKEKAEEDKKKEAERKRRDLNRAIHQQTEQRIRKCVKNRK